MDARSPVLITSRSEFRTALRNVFAEAASAHWQELWLCDADFADWPLGEIEVIEQLTQWAGPQRRMTLLALHYDEFSQRHARWVQWRRQWSHLVTCRVLQDLQIDAVPILFYVSEGPALRLHNRVHYRGSVSREAAAGVEARELIEAISQRSVEAFPATTLGL